jgi:hypothetical protein
MKTLFSRMRESSGTMSRRKTSLFIEPLESRTLFSVANISQNPMMAESNEGTIAVNARNPSRLFAAYNEFQNDEVVGVGASYSTDGGASWQPSDLAALLPSLGDPDAAFDQFGNLFFAYLSQPDAMGNTYVVVAESFNSGASFARSIRFDSFPADQPKVATGPAGIIAPAQVVISWEAVPSQAIYARAAAVLDFGDVDMFGGAQQVPNSAGSPGNVAIGPDGTVMVDWHTTANLQGPSTVYGATARPLLIFGFNAPFEITTSQVGLHTRLGDPGPLFDDSEGISVEPNLAWDRSGGSHDGRIHVVYTDLREAGSQDSNIYARYSDDQGRTWSAPAKVNDDLTVNSQFLPQIALDQTTGNVALAWYDARNSPDNTTVELYASVSTDGGGTWLPNRMLSSGDSDSHASMNNNNFGDYNEMDAFGGYFYPIWADNSGQLDPTPNNLPSFDMATVQAAFSAFGGPPPSRMVMGAHPVPGSPVQAVALQNEGHAEASENFLLTSITLARQPALIFRVDVSALLHGALATGRAIAPPHEGWHIPRWTIVKLNGSKPGDGDLSESAIDGNTDDF